MGGGKGYILGLRMNRFGSGGVGVVRSLLRVEGYHGPMSITLEDRGGGDGGRKWKEHGRLLIGWGR